MFNWMEKPSIFIEEQENFWNALTAPQKEDLALTEYARTMKGIQSFERGLTSWITNLFNILQGERVIDLPEKATLGQMFRQLSEKWEAAQEIESDFDNFRQKRNHLAHTFLVEISMPVTYEGYLSYINELQSIKIAMYKFCHHFCLTFTTSFKQKFSKNKFYRGISDMAKVFESAINSIEEDHEILQRVSETRASINEIYEKAKCSCWEKGERKVLLKNLKDAQKKCYQQLESVWQSKKETENILFSIIRGSKRTTQEK